MSAPSVHVRIGEVRVLATEGVLFAIGLGSCVAVALYDRDQKISGLAHVMLPECRGRRGDSPGRYAASAVPRLVELMVAAGAQKAGLTARIVGGAAMFGDILPASGARLGDRNVSAVKAALELASIPIAGEDVGGAHGRSVYMDVNNGSVVIRSVQRPDVTL